MTEQRYYTPLVRAIAERHGVDLDHLTGTGVGGRVTKADVQGAAVKRSVSTTALGRAKEVGISAAELLGLHGSGRDGRVQDLDVLALATAKEYAADGRPLDFAAIEGSGPNGAVRVSDVHEAARTGSARVATPVSLAGPRASAGTGPYAVNPLLEQARTDRPAAYVAALTEGPKPTLFQSGDLPVYMVSGADPNLLLKLPWQVRHSAARATSAELATIFESYGGADAPMIAELERAQDSENLAYARRVQDWISGPPVDWSVERSPERQRADEEMYQLIYGAEDARKAQIAADAKAEREAKARFEREQAERARARQERDRQARRPGPLA